MIKPFALVVVSASSLLIAGCGAVPIPVAALLNQSPTASVPGPAFTGSVFGGQQPLINSRIHLYAAGTSGYGIGYTYSTGTDLLGSNVVTTGTGGKFSISSDYTCPTAATDIYVVAVGGNAISTQPSNTGISLIAALGPCNSPAANAGIGLNINELTTVAAVYALAPFMADYADIGSSSTNVTGLNNAFATAREVVNTATGLMPGTILPSGAVLPTNELNTLADMLAACVNSNGGSAPNGTSDGSPCGNLFALTPNAGTYPKDTAAAMLNIARNPSQQASRLNSLVGTVVPFQPTVGSTPPSAWTVAITFAPTNLRSPQGIAADQKGNIWVAESSGHSAFLLSPTGALTGSYGSGKVANAIAIDPSGNAWTTGLTTASTVVQVTPTGTVSSFSSTGNGTPSTLAIDGSGQIWVGSSSNGLLVFSNTGTQVSGTPYTALSGSGGVASIAISGR